MAPEPNPAAAPLSAADAALVQALRGGGRRALAKTITLLESARPEHQLRAQAVLGALLPNAGGALRLGLSGVPGVGKSTFIEALGLWLIGAGHRVAVLAIDPSSSLSGGSILGDKTRMEKLCRAEAAYIRPSPSRGTLGGVAARTREAMLACEAAGYDVVIIETVGVGQSETAVAAMTDVFALLQLPNAGDDLQAIKKGIVEVADIIAFNKCDLDALAAQRAQAQMRAALALLRGKAAAEVPVLRLSAARGEGLQGFWEAVCAVSARRRAAGQFEARRVQQAVAWMWAQVEEGLRQRFETHAAVQAALPPTLGAVAAGTLSASAAAARLLRCLED